METYIYEQPLTEVMRVCLRLEYIFRQIRHFMVGFGPWEIQAAVMAMIELISLIDRPDLKGKLLNAIQLQITNLTQFTARKDVDIDRSKLELILLQLNDAQEKLSGIHGKLGQNLRDNEFFSVIKQRIGLPAGICNFALPSFHLWLNQPINVLHRELQDWLAEFSLLENITNLLLQLTRNTGASKRYSAAQGFFQEALSPNVPYQLIRVILPFPNIFCDISVGRHRLSIYFFYFLGSKKRAQQVSEDIEFDLLCC